MKPSAAQPTPATSPLAEVPTIVPNKPVQGFAQGLKDRRGQGNPKLKQTFSWLRRIAVSILFCVTLTLVGLTFYVLNKPIATGPVLLTLINLNILLILLCALYIGRNLLVTFLERRGRLRRSRLPFRFLGIFSIVAIIPVIVVSSYSLFMLNLGLETWFSTKVSRALEGSLLVAEAYLDEHEKALLVETQALAQDPTLSNNTFLLDPLALEQVLQFEREERNLDALSLYTREGVLVSSSNPTTSLTAPTDIATMLSGIRQSPLIFMDDSTKRVLVAVPVSTNMVLITARGIHPDVLARVNQTEAAFREYDDVLKERGHIQFLFTLFLILLVLGTLAGAIWAGIRLAEKIVRPVTELVHATNRVSAGALDVRLEPNDDDEMGILTQSFNRMTQQLKQNRTLVEKKNKELDVRRKTMEALLTGVSSGVVALDIHGNIKTLNQTARKMLALEDDKPLHEQIPDLGQIFDTFLKDIQAQPRELVQMQLRLTLPDGEARTLLVRLVPQRQTLSADGNDEENESVEIISVVMTCDDISPLISAQKVAAWSDVARRLAHEIKNPLTPIQLSAERLKRKYLKKMDADDQELFGQLTETIIRQTEDMRGMLNEFSDFARMPSPQFKPENLGELLDEVAVLEKTGRTDIQFDIAYDIPKADTAILADRAHVTRVLTNVIENAVNAVQERPCDGDKKLDSKENSKNLPTGEIKIVVKMSLPDTLAVQVLDNGCGLPTDVATEDLFDPYVTTRKKGTGLGLAIVRRVMEEHNGTVKLMNRETGGTLVELSFPRVA